jgi:hypothetical protein
VISARFTSIASTVVLIALLAGCGGQPWPVGPYAADPTHAMKPDTHWHAALGVYDCDHWLGDTRGSGIWNWPAVTPGGGPARVDDPVLYAGLHSHDDGVIHMEPLVASEAGRNATVGLYFDYGGWKLSTTGYSFLGTSVENGGACRGGSGTLRWETARWNPRRGAQEYLVGSGNPALHKLAQADIVVIAFLPAGRSIASIGNPPSLPYLARAFGYQDIQPARFGSTVR